MESRASRYVHPSQYPAERRPPMGKRLTKIYTRTGDDGTTGLAGGARVSKDSQRIAAIGDVDELNSAIGIALAEELPDLARARLTAVQHDLFDVGGELSLPGHAIVSDTHVTRLERELDDMNADLPGLTEFILPGGSRAAAAMHLARAVCRRAERTLVALGRTESVPPLLPRYLNRLSDWLFVTARVLNAHAGRADVLWQQGKNRKA
jgi:cob(I)alamin adenosyltransferase